MVAAGQHRQILMLAWRRRGHLLLAELVVARIGHRHLLLAKLVADRIGHCRLQLVLELAIVRIDLLLLLRSVLVLELRILMVSRTIHRLLVTHFAMVVAVRIARHLPELAATLGLSRRDHHLVLVLEAVRRGHCLLVIIIMQAVGRTSHLQLAEQLVVVRIGHLLSDQAVSGADQTIRRLCSLILTLDRNSV